MEVHEDDYASMLAEVEGRVDERTLRLALGLGGDELEHVRFGKIPSESAAERLRALHGLVRSGADLEDPMAVLRALGERGGGAGALAILPHFRKWIVAFVIADFVLVAVAAALFVLR